MLAEMSLTHLGEVMLGVVLAMAAVKLAQRWTAKPLASEVQLPAVYGPAWRN